MAGVIDNSGLIPRTKRRTALSVAIYAGFGSYKDFVSQLQAGTPPTALRRIGSIESFSETESRDANSQYELDADYPGEIVDVIPTRPERELTINRAVLYSSSGAGDIFEALGIGPTTGWNIMNQVIPLLLLRYEVTPTATTSTNNTQNTSNTGTKTVITVWEDCWLTASPKEFDVMGDLKIIQSCTIKAGRKYTIVI